VLSDWFARTHPDACASRTLVVDGRAVPVVGIAAEGFVGTTPGNAAPAMWLPLALAERSSRRLDERGWSWLWLFGRRQPGVSFPRARAAIQTVHARLAESNRGTLDDSATVVEGVGLRPPDRREAIRISSMLMAAALVVWLVAAANAAGLHLSRALGAARDTAVRLAIGAPRARVIRGFLVEHTLLAAGGGAAAWIVARPVARAIESALPYDLALSFDPDARGLVFAVAATATVSLLVAVRPFWTAVAPDLVESLKQAREPGGARSRAAVVLVAAQVALSAGLLISTGLLAKSLRAAAATHPGFDASGVVMASFRRQPQGREPALLREEIVRRALGVAGATGAGLATSLPLVSPQSTRSVFGPGAAYDPDASAVDVIASHVDRGFFETLRIPLVEGRWPSRADWSDGSTPVVVSPPAARRLWPEAGPDRRADSGRLSLVATAVTGDLRARSIRESSQPVMFLPLEAGDQMPSWLVLRTTAPPHDAIAGLRAALDPLRSDLVVGRIEMMAPAVAASMADTRIAADVAVPLALLSVLFSAAGLYGVASRRVLDRRRELGVRLALGASAARLCAGVVRDTLLWAAVGLTAGVALGVALGGLMRSLLFGVRAADPAVIAAAMSIVAATAAAAALLPAWRAAHIDPQTALRID
jgi:predicted permease